MPSQNPSVEQVEHGTPKQTSNPATTLAVHSMGMKEGRAASQIQQADLPQLRTVPSKVGHNNWVAPGLTTQAYPYAAALAPFSFFRESHTHAPPQPPQSNFQRVLALFLLTAMTPILAGLRVGRCQGGCHWEQESPDCSTSAPPGTKNRLLSHASN